MHSWIESLSPFNSQTVALFLDAAIKSFVVLTAAGLFCWGARRASAATRHWIWFLAVASLPFLPLLSSLLPSWQRPLWTVSTGSSGNQISLAVEFAPVKASALAPVPSPDRLPPVTGASPQRPAPPRLAAHLSANGLAWAIIAWGIGLLLLLIRIAEGQFQLGTISRTTQRVEAGEWMTLLKESCARLGLHRRVILCQSRRNLMPLTWGWWRPVVLLPADADHWPAERRRVVLLHELAHVKRWDCLTQLLARIVGALFWFNPLVWLAARKMCIERERACDDLVLSGGCRASDYAGHLVDIARTLRPAPQMAAIAMARSPQLDARISSIIDASQKRSLSRPVLIALGLAVMGLVGAIAAQTPEAATKPWWDARLRAFFEQKLKQEHDLDAQIKKPVAPEVWPFFEAGVKGDWATTTNLWVAMRKRAHQYEGTVPDERLSTAMWSPILECDLAWEQYANWGEKYVLAYGNDIIQSIPPGSIYFGGTDPGRGVITAMCESHVEAKPFFTITQNALADGTYLDYVQRMYGARMYVPTFTESQEAFSNYVADATLRYQTGKLKPGENVTKDKDGKAQVGGQIAVMDINARIVKRIFDKNPDREFYIEESFPLDWMYPHLSPNGLIMKINRQPLDTLSDDLIRQDREYWTNYLRPILGDWLNENTSVEEIEAFADRVFIQHDLKEFTGDPAFVQNTEWEPQAFSKLRSSIGGVYAWRAEQATDAAEKARMVRAADFAFRQAIALCPYSPEAVYRYVNLLRSEHRDADALLIAETAARIPSVRKDKQAQAQLQYLVRDLKSASPGH